MRGPAYEPSPQVKPVVHSLFDAKQPFGDAPAFEAMLRELRA